MKMSWTRMGLFCGAGALSIGLVWWTDRPRPSRVDRHTGLELVGHFAPRRVPPPIPSGNLARREPPAHEVILERARATGNAPDALIVLRAPHKGIGERSRPVIEKAVADLTAELAEAPPRPPERRLPWPLDDPPTDPTVLYEHLTAMERDTEIGRATEAFFQPMIPSEGPTRREVRDAVEAYWPPDQVAAMAIDLAGGAGAADADLCLLVARAFQAAGRNRGRLRWLLRAYARVYVRALGPGGSRVRAEARPRVVDALTRAYGEYDRSLEGFAIVSAAVANGQDDIATLELRAEMSRWTDNIAAEIDTLEWILARKDDDDVRRRISTLYVYTGRPGSAMPHARLLAERSGDPDSYGHAARLALLGSRIDDAFDLLTRAAELAEDPRPWRERIAEYAIQDLRLERATAELEWLDEHYPADVYESQLEVLYRTQRDRAKLVKLLDRQLARKFDEDREQEAYDLHVSLDHSARVVELVHARLRRTATADPFFRAFSLYFHCGIEGVMEVAKERAPSIVIGENEIHVVIAIVDPYTVDPAFRRALDELLDAFEQNAQLFKLRLALIDRGSTVEESVELLEEMVGDHPGDEDLARLWVQRAMWTDQLETVVRAREHLATLAPDDLENRKILADLHEGASRLEQAEVHWRYVAQKEGPGSDAAARLIEVLLMRGDEKEALVWLERRANEPNAALVDRIKLAERFFEADRPDRALQIYEQIIAADPKNAAALKRVGQIRSWSNDPEGAIPYFERSLAITGPGDGEILHLLGEAHWSVDRLEIARPYHEQALPLLRKTDPMTEARELQIAKTLSRFGRIEEARAICERLIAKNPRNEHLVLDFADIMLAGNALEYAREAVDRARPTLGDNRRFLRLEGLVLMQEQRWEDAIPVLRRRINLHGEDAAVRTDLGRSLEHAGYRRQAVDAYVRALELQPNNREVAISRRRLWDQVALHFETRTTYETVENDTTFKLIFAGSVLTDDERTRLSLGLVHGNYTGRAAAVDVGQTDVESDITTLSAAAAHRLDETSDVGGGLDLYAGRDDADSVGMWAGYRMEFLDPFQTLYARIHFAEVFDEPASAAGLGGQSDGFRVEGFREFSKEWFGSVVLGWESLTVTDPRSGEVTDSRVSLELLGGYRFQETTADVGDPLRPRELPPLEGASTVAGSHAEDDDFGLALWSTLTLLDLADGELANVVPVGDEFYYLTAHALYVQPLGSGFTFEAEPALGTDLNDPGLFFSIHMGASWRPTEDMEVRLFLRHGRSLGRADGGDSDDSSTAIELAGTLRW